MTEAPPETLPTEVPLQDASTLAALRRRSMILAAVLVPAILATIWLVVSETRTQRVADLAEKAIPRTLVTKNGVWTSTEMHFTALEMEILETSDYVFRTYQDGKGTPIDLCVVFSEDNRKGTHPPDICLEGSGYRIISRSTRDILVDTNTTLSMAEIVASAGSGGGGQNQYTYFAYFYKCGDTFTPSFYKQQMEIVWNGLTRRNAAGALIRYSMPMNSVADLDAARARVDTLVRATFPPIRDGLNPRP